jgi:phosphoribosyl 1,2-cyclic phosphodiesterase
MKYCVLGSGSSGNSTFIETNDNRFLIDAGFSAKKIIERLSKIDVCPSTLSAILITHEHGDHIQGAGVLSRKFNVPIYITKKSYDACKHKLGKLNPENIGYLEGSFYLSQDTYIQPFDVMHDAVCTVGYNIFEKLSSKLSIATDIGYATNVVKDKFKDSDAIIIESNYDEKMLLVGPYPWDLKQRVKSKNGHFSNTSCAKFIEDVHSSRLKQIVLAHISKDNNSARIALETTTKRLQAASLDTKNVYVSYQDEITELFNI